MNLKQAIEITKQNPDLNIFIPLKYDLGLMVRKAEKPNKVPAYILEKAPFLDQYGYEVCVHQLSSIKNRKSKGNIKKGIPNAPDTWAPWGIVESDLQIKSLMLI
ncbi:hypothetical protein C0J08_14730 [Marinomonas sp. CT5]|uniref:hypothetical protein n=1 Tax=Marinomonas sp. CT5 TaxID=2066133 RepID=UPI001BAF3893|nr:hypothetical protein [Marinomonas sp. CT5]QUX96576.1 hypothetical protein C0J08_14730 [Marinomonas sp. CT5]